VPCDNLLGGAGLWGNLAGVAPASAVFISVYEPVKRSVEASVSSDQVGGPPVVLRTD